MSWDAERVFCYCNLDCRQNSGAWLCYTSARSPTCCRIRPSMVRSRTSWKRAADPTCRGCCVLAALPWFTAEKTWWSMASWHGEHSVFVGLGLMYCSKSWLIYSARTNRVYSSTNCTFD
eukprot:1049734-Rhodomonas_salina.1